MKYLCTLLQTNSESPDGPATIRMIVNSETTPIYLSDFSGGTAEIDDGRSDGKTTASINLLDDDRRLEINFTDGYSAELHPFFVREKDGRLTAIPLKEDQILDYYIQDRHLAFVVKNLRIG